MEEVERNQNMTHQELHFNPFTPLPTEEDESKYEKYFELESSYMAASGYSKNRDAFLFRDRAVLLISKYGQCDNFPFIAYLAMNYFDRYMSRKDPVLDYPRLKQHDVDVIAVACLIIAWKMKGLYITTPGFLVNFIFSTSHAERLELAEIPLEQLVSMEISILNELNWKMRAVTPFCFVPYFCDKLKAKHGFRPRTICEIIVHAQDGIWITEIRPSVIALSAFFAASDYLYPGKIIEFFTQIIFERNFLEVQRSIDACTERMIRLCRDLNLMIEGAVPENSSTPSFKIQAGRQYSGIYRGEASYLPVPELRIRENPPASPFEKGKGKMWEIVEDREEQQDQGKNIWEDVYQVPEIPKMAEDSEEVQFSFRLRWRANDTDWSPLYNYLYELTARDEAVPMPNEDVVPETEPDQLQSPNNGSLPKCCSCRCSVL
ncbi:hypothetical protein TIFTF001_032094 [Ficus carica]|uniref:B-like cyclin n=1 Tax=Ficus carica TaxID=3494 RepID=A0AA88DZU6_FICCA|nr:hypothetical protein TIFTF001_032094 [Ficus carica]